MKCFRPGRVTLSAWAACLVLAGVYAGLGIFKPTAVPCGDADRPAAPSATLERDSIHSDHVNRAIEWQGRPTPAFPEVLKIPARGLVIEVPVEVELAPSGKGS